MNDINFISKDWNISQSGKVWRCICRPNRNVDHVRLPWYRSDRIKVTVPRSQVSYPCMIMFTKFEQPAMYSCWDIALKRFTYTRSLCQGQTKKSQTWPQLPAYMIIFLKHEKSTCSNSRDMAWTRFQVQGRCVPTLRYKMIKGQMKKKLPSTIT